MKKKMISIALVAILVLSSLLILLPPIASDSGGDTGARQTDVMMVSDDVRGTPAGFWTAVNAVKALGFSVTAYGTESAVPSNWDTVGYKAVFWHCGGKPPTYWQGANSVNQRALVRFVQNGGHVFYSGDTVNYAIGWYLPMRDFIGHYYFGPMGGGGNTRAWTFRVSDPTHPINNDPNVLPSQWTSKNSNIIWWSPSFIVNNGKAIIDTPQISSIYNMNVIVWEPAQDPLYPGGPYDNYGKTVYLRTCFVDQFGATTVGVDPTVVDMITPFEQNVATWFLGSAGIRAEGRIEPQSLNLDSMGNYINIKVENFPDNPEYIPMDVDGSSVELAGVGADLKYGTWNSNKYIGKVDRLLVEDAIGAPGVEVEVEFKGKLYDGTGFMGIATIKAH